MLRSITISSLLGLTLFFSTASPIKAQLIVNDSVSANELANILIGSGVTIANVSLNCSPGAFGTFDGTQSNIGIDNGIMLTTGTVQNAVGPNNLGSTGFDHLAPGDSALTTLSGFPTFDACILEFDITPERDTLKFEYVFGSEEYLEFVNMGFNDVFAFFISGPGITGTQNIALIPGTSIAVTIDNVNSTLNPAYYFDNETPPGQTVQYDGFTVGLTATIPLQPGGIYHLRLAIADAGDGVYDSGVFIAEISSTGCPASQMLTNSHVTPNNARLSWSPVGFADHYVIRGWPIGSTNYSFLNVPNGAPNFKNVAGLANNTCYAWQIMTYCDPAGNEVSQWSMIDTFCTGCYGPDTTYTNPIVSNGAQLNWSPSPGSVAYEIRGKRVGATQWTTILIGGSQTSMPAFGLLPATSYHWSIRAWCDTGGVRVSNWAPLRTFTTTTAARMAAPNSSFISLEGENNTTIRVSPNPVISGKKVSINNVPTENLVQIYTIEGQMIRTHSNHDGDLSIPTQFLAPGVYFLRFVDAEGENVCRKLLVK